MKTCSVCKVEKRTVEFYNSRNPRHLDGLQPRCKSCQNARRDFNVFKKDHPDLTEEDFMNMYFGQDGKCASCKEHLPIDAVNIDHDHGHCGPKKSCAECRRGLLCRACNLSLGIMNEDTRRIENLALYSDFCGQKRYEETNDVREPSQPFVLQPSGRLQQPERISSTGKRSRYARLRNYRPWKSNRPSRDVQRLSR